MNNFNKGESTINYCQDNFLVAFYFTSCTIQTEQFHYLITIPKNILKYSSVLEKTCGNIKTIYYET